MQQANSHRCVYNDKRVQKCFGRYHHSVDTGSRYPVANNELPRSTAL